jgi:eukaryotic-like serine/threonine-protein kinase
MVGTPLTPPLQHGRYSLHALVAAGGMATVHVGLQRGDDKFARIVAIKRLHGAAAINPEFRDALRDEARVTSRIHHPNVVATLDVVESESELWVVMEYVDGETLVNLRRLTGGDPMDPALVATIAYGVLQGLHAAHEARDETGQPLNVVHRDISPQNIIVGCDGVPRVLDFGIAKAEGRVQSTQQGALKGKVAYMSPEQVWGKGIDRRADVFAASVVFWELLCGRKLHTNEQSDEAILAQVLQGNVDPPSAFGIKLPPALEAVLMRGLAKNRDDRYPTANAMALAIEEAVPLLTSRRLGLYVSEVAKSALEQRRATIIEVERVWLDAASEPRLATVAAIPGAAGAGPVVFPPAADAQPLFAPFAPVSPLAPFAPTSAQSGERPAELSSRELLGLGADIEATSLDIRRKRKRAGLVGASVVAVLLLLLLVGFVVSRPGEAPAAATSATPPRDPVAAVVPPADSGAVALATTATSTPPPSPTTTGRLGGGGTSPTAAAPPSPSASVAGVVPGPMPVATAEKKSGLADCKRHPLILDPKTKIYRVDPRCRSTLVGK